MTKVFIATILLLLTHTLVGQSKIDTKLKQQLDSIYVEDQKYRELLSSPLLMTKTDSLAQVYKVSKGDLINHLIKLMQSSDSSNMAAIEKIFQTYGYTGKTLVGTPTNEAAFFVVQHSQNIDKYLPLIEKAAKKNELPFKLYAMMLDRSLMYKGKEQVYGTQAKGFEIYNAATGKKEFVRVIWAIKNPAEVNKLRQKAGFTETVEENAKRLNIEYKALSLKEILAMQNANNPKTIDTKLKSLIDSLFIVDQQVQQNMITAFQRGVSYDSIKIYENVEKQTFARHIPILKNIINKYGYPTSEKVGSESASNFFILVQHADTDVKFQEAMLADIEKQVDNKQLNGKEYAYLYDRVQINSGKPQFYGTQLNYDANGNAVPKNLKDEKAVNQRRKDLGMETIESYLERATEIHKKQNQKK